MLNITREKEDLHHDKNLTKGKTLSRVSPGRNVRFYNESASAVQPRGMEEHSPLLHNMKSVGPEKCLRSVRKNMSMSWGPIGGQTHRNDTGEAGRPHF
eukprot:6177506-Heterocapsa_arctica.AAC.1